MSSRRIKKHASESSSLDVQPITIGAVEAFPDNINVRWSSEKSGLMRRSQTRVANRVDISCVDVCQVSFSHGDTGVVVGMWLKPCGHLQVGIGSSSSDRQFLVGLSDQEEQDIMQLAFDAVLADEFTGDMFGVVSQLCELAYQKEIDAEEEKVATGGKLN